MARKFFKRVLPNPRELQDRWYLKPFKSLLRDPALWAIQRKGLSRGLALGLFVGALPVPGHVLIVAILSMLVRVNIPVSIVACLFTNPFTVGPFFYFTYRVGSMILGVPPEPLATDMSFQWLMDSFEQIWIPMFLGSVITGSILALTGFIAVNIIWRASLLIRYRKRNRQSNRAPGSH